MALPPIQYRRASPGATPSYQLARRSAQSKQAVVNAAMNAVGQVAEAYTEDQVNNENAAHRQRVLDAVRVTEENQTLSKAELKKMGVYDQIEVPAGISEDAIPKHLWQTAYLQKVSEESRLASAERIQQPRMRNRWRQETQRSDDSMLSRSVQQSARDAQRWHQDSMTNAWAAAMENEDFDRAKEILESQAFADVFAATPGLKDKMRADMQQKEMTADYELRMMQSDYNALESVKSDLMQDEEIKDTERRRLFFMAVQRQNSAITAAKKAEADGQDDFEADITQKIYQEFETGNRGAVITFGEVLAAKDYMSRAGYQRVLKLYQTMATDGPSNVQTDPRIVASMALFESRLLAGDYGENYFDAIKEQRDWLNSSAIETDAYGNQKVIIAGADLLRYSDSLTELRDRPFTNLNYQRMKAETTRSILGVEPGLEQTIEADLLGDATAVVYSAALADLDEFIRQNGGTSADLQKWQRERLPAFMNEAADARIQGLPPMARSYVDQAKIKVGPYTRVDIDAARDLMNVDLQMATGDKALLLRQSIAEFDAWAEREGRFYVQ